MPFFTKKIENKFELVRRYYWMTGDGEVGDLSLNTSFISGKSSGGAYGGNIDYDSGLTFSRDAETLTKPSWITLGFDGSSTMHSAVLINDELDPGHFIEISGYIFSGAKMNDTTDQLQNDFDVLEVLYEWASNINQSNDYHFLNLPSPDSSGVHTFGQTVGSHTTTEAEFRGRGVVPMFSAGNIGTMGWEISDGRSSTRYSQVLPDDSTDDPTRDGTLKKYAITDNSNSMLKRFFRIVVFNNHATNKAYLKIAPKTNGGSGKFGLFGIQSKVFSVPGSYTGIAFTHHDSNTSAAEITPSGISLGSGGGIFNPMYDPATADPFSVVPHGAVDSSIMSAVSNRTHHYQCISFGSELGAPNGHRGTLTNNAFADAPYLLMPLGGRRRPTIDDTSVEGDYIFIAPFDGVVESISCRTSEWSQYSGGFGYSGTNNLGAGARNNTLISIAKATSPSWTATNVSGQTNAQFMSKFTDIVTIGPDRYMFRHDATVTASSGAGNTGSSGYTGSGAFSAGDWLIVRIKATTVEGITIAGSIMLKYTLPSAGAYD